MGRCKCEVCGRKTYKSSEYCVFHYGLQFKDLLDTLEKEEPSSDSWKKARKNIREELDKIKADFIKKFNDYIEEVLSKSDSRVLDFTAFVFPRFEPHEWAQLWKKLGGDEYGSGVDLEALGLRIRFQKAVFLGETIFNFWKFGDGVSFAGARIYAPISFSGAQFGNQVSFTKAEFKFDKGGIDFVKARFGDGISFSEARIYAPISFNSARFGNQVSFIEAKFKFDEKEVNFVGAHFGDGIYFDKAQIQVPIDFNSAYFGKKVSFYKVIFSSDRGMANFGKTIFDDGVSFNESRIFMPVNFNGAHFGGQILFAGTIFDFDKYKINFMAVKFGDGVFFDKAYINAPIDFSSARFGNQVLFSKTTFGKKSSIRFVGTKFGNGIHFYSTKLFSKLYISRSSLDGLMEFRNVQFEKDSKIILKDLTFLSDGHVRIDRSTMERVIWSGTNLFQDHPRAFIISEKDTAHGWDEWPPRSPQKYWCKHLNKLIKLWASVDEAERIYRQVRLIMEYNGRFSDAGDVYVVEMFLRTLSRMGRIGQKIRGLLRFFLFHEIPSILKPLMYLFHYVVMLLSIALYPLILLLDYVFSRRTAFSEGFLLFIYGLLSGWGERIGRPVAHLLATSLLAGILLALMAHNGTFLSNLMHTSFYSLKTMIFPFVQSNPPDMIEKKSLLFQGIDLFLRVFGITLITLFVLALRRRFNRQSAQ